ncbi:DUF1819 family protein [Bacillota bacterium]
MDISMPYNGTLTAEQFLFYEMRIVSKQYLENKSIEEIIAYIKRDNLFQYPTERMVIRIARACYKRLVALDNDKLVFELANAPAPVAKRINLYAMMCYNRLVREFMEGLIGEKYRQQYFSYTKKDINVFFSRLQEQNDDIAAWSGQTIAKLKQGLTKCLIETEMLDSVRDTTLNPIFISSERARLLKQQDKLSEQLKEITAIEEKIHHLADQNIEIDLNDGVKKNYEIFTDVLAKI